MIEQDPQNYQNLNFGLAINEVLSIIQKYFLSNCLLFFVGEAKQNLRDNLEAVKLFHSTKTFNKFFSLESFNLKDYSNIDELTFFANGFVT